MRRKIIYLWITVFVLFVGNLAFFFLLKKESSNVSLENVLISTASMKDYVVEELLMHMEFDSDMLKDVVVAPNDYTRMIVDTLYNKKDSCMLSKLLQNNKVLFVFAQYACNTCVNDQLITLNKLGKRIGYENIVILTDKNSHNISLFLKSNKSKLNFYETNIDSLDLFDRPPVSALLLYVCDNKIATSFVVDMDTKEYARCFYRFVEKQYLVD